MAAENHSTGLADGVIRRALTGERPRPVVTTFFDEETCTATHVVHDPGSGQAAVIDPVLNYDPASGRIRQGSAERIATYVEERKLSVEWLLETHVHADHLSAGPWLQERVGGKLAIGANIIEVQDVFGKVFNAGTDFERDGSQFDELFSDGDFLPLGACEMCVLEVPGHTPADVAYVIGDAVFPGDTIFMPDYGTARTDFPGGDARQLFQSIRRLLSLSGEARLFLCHDYKSPSRDEYCWETSIAAERDHNVHVHDGIDEEQFVAMRTARDRKLPTPKLMMPAVQVNMRAGRLPDAEANGRRYLKIPIEVSDGG